MIQAAAKQGPILTEAVGVEWITAAEGTNDETPKPKRFSMTAYTGGPMQVSNYGPPVVIELTGLTAKAPVPILRDHELSRVVGHADQVDVGATSLKLSGIVSGVGADATEVVASATNGFPWKASVGVRPDKLEFVGEGIKTTVNGKIFTGPLEVARKSTLGEVSFVAMAADRKTTTRIAATAAPTKNKGTGAMNTFREWIEAMGFSLDDLREDQTQLLQAKYDAEVKAAADLKKAAEIKAAESEDPKAIEAAAKPAVVEAPTFDLSAVEIVYAQHETAIKATAADYRTKVPEAEFDKLYDAAIKGALEAKSTALKEKWAAPRLGAEYIVAAAQFKADLMVAERPKGPAIHSSSQDGITEDVLGAAILATGQIAKPEDHCSPELLDAAHKRFPRGIGLQEMIVATARANGWSGYSFKQDSQACMRHAFAPIQAGGFSTVAITSILSNVANKFLLEGFGFVEQAWREIASIRPVADFKTTTSYRLTGESTYKLLPPSGEIEHGTLGDESYTNKADTYALMLAVTRTDIINDDLGAITTVPRRLGNGGGRTLNHIFWTVYLGAQGTLFTAARDNYFDGADTVLSIDSLTTAEQMFMDLKDADGEPIGHMPKILLVPTALSASSATLFNSAELRNTTASTKYPIANPHQGKFRPVVSRYMGTSSYTGYSMTAWNMLADPRELSTVEVCFLNGQQSPVIEQADANFDTLGVQMRGYFDFGVNTQDYRGGVRSKGAA